MADFIQKTVTKSAVRKFTSPIANISTFQSLVTDIITNNPWGCFDYVSGGETIPGVVKGSEYIAGKIVYEDAEAKELGSVSVKCPSMAAFNTTVISILADATIRSVMGGSPTHDSSEDTFSAVIKCNHSNGEKYTVTLKRDSITVSSYDSDSIVTAIETWADGIALLD